MTDREFWDEHLESIVKCCQRAVRGTNCSFEEALSEAWARLGQVMRTYRADHPSGASLKTHVMTGLRLYLFKLAGLGGPVSGGGRAERDEKRRRDKYARYLELTQPTRPGAEPINGRKYSELEDSRRVQSILSRLSESDAEVLCLRYCEGYSLEDIADYYEVGRTTAFGKVKRALDAAKEVASELEDDDE